MCFKCIVKKEGKRKVTFRMGENKTDIVFVLIMNEHRRFMQNVEAIAGEFQNTFVLLDIDKKKMRNVVRNTCAVRRKISFLKDVKKRKRFRDNVVK